LPATLQRRRARCKILHIAQSSDEGLPYSGLTFGKNRRLYGATSGNNAAKPRQYGTVFKIVP
jgi:hypothetical protein